MSNQLLLKNFLATGAIGASLIVIANADGSVSVAGAGGPATALFGVNDDIALANGDYGDIVKAGIADVVFGGVIAAGDPLTSDVNGNAVKAAPAAGVNVRIIGFAEVAGVAGDIGQVNIAPGVIQG
ncbi:MAG: DUF2190 family protein [Bradyrhizobium sp.]|nr:DUF2190 family protein [Bradyrhizobium sp.]